MNRSQILFVGIDVHKDTHTAVGLSPFGEKVFEMTIGNEAVDFISLVEKTKVEAERVGLVPRFGLEDVHSWGERLSSFLSEEGLPVVAVAPILVDHRRSKMTHPEKSDSLDASGVAAVMIQRIDTLPVYKLTEEVQKAKQIRELSLEREWLVKERARLKNQLHVLLHRIHNTGYRAKFKDPFSKKALRYWMRSVPKDTDTILTQRTKRALRRLLDLREEIQEIEEELTALMEQSGYTLATASGCGTVSRRTRRRDWRCISLPFSGELGQICRLRAERTFIRQDNPLEKNQVGQPAAQSGFSPDGPFSNITVGQRGRPYLLQEENLRGQD